MTWHRVTLCALLLALSAVMLCGCSADEHKVRPTTTSSNAEMTTSTSETAPNESLPAGYKLFTSNGIQLTLPDDFVEEVGQQRLTFHDKYSAILIEKESFTEHPSLPTMPLGDYCKTLIATWNLETPIQIIDGLYCWDYEIDIQNEGVRYNYFVVVYKTSTDFWIVQFVSDSREAALHRDSFITWAKMIEFTE